MKKFSIAIIISLLFGFYLFAEDSVKGKLTLKFQELKSNEGTVYVKLYDTTSEKFPKTEFSIAIKSESIIDNKAIITFYDLPYGVYAFSTFHDENNNEVMDSNLFHIPIEGYAFSNNASSNFGPPSFEKASFIIDKEELEYEIKLNY